MVFSFVIIQFLFGVPIFSQSIRMSMSVQTNDPILYLNVEYPSLSIKFLWLTTTPQHQEAVVHNTCRWLFHHKHSWPYHFYEMHLSVFLKVSTLIRLSAFFFEDILAAASYIQDRLPVPFPALSVEAAITEHSLSVFVLSLAP